MKKLLLVLLVLSFPGAVWCQKDGATDYQKQYVRLYQEYSADPDNVLNLVDMANFFADANNPQYNLPLAKGYIQHAEDLYTQWVKGDSHNRELRKLIRSGVTITTIRQLRKDIDARAVQYVKSHASDIRSSEAGVFIEAFANNSEIVSVLRSKAVNDAYQKACQENTMQSYYAFLAAHKGSPLADSADMHLAPLSARFLSALGSDDKVDSVAQLYAASPAVQHAAMMQKSRMAYAAACRANTVESYSLYLEKYPRGADYLEALSRLQKLRDVDFSTISSVEELADYAESHVDNPLADSALARLRVMVFRNHDEQAAKIYLSRFPLDEHYSAVYREYYSWFAAEGNLQPIQHFAQENPNYPYRLTLKSDLELGAKIDAFDLRKPYVESDFDTMSTVIRLLTGRKAAFVALQRILQQQIAKKDWAAAKSRMQKFSLSFEDVSVDEYQELNALLTNASGPVAAIQLSADSITHAIMHPSGSMFFTRYHQGRQNVYFARRGTGKKSGWHVAGRVKVQGANANVVAYNFFNQGTQVLIGMGGDIWTAKVENDTLWTLDQHLPNPVNTPFLEKDAFFLADGSGLLLASDRPHGHNMQQSGAYFHGDRKPATDIYFIPFTSGRWGDAINLGVAVNSEYCELSPILSRNMRTLYFITDARGLGYGDVYRTTRSDIDDWTHWSKPVNMGRGVNGAFDESSITFSADERQVALTSRSPKGGSPAVYSFATSHDTTSAYRTVNVDLRPVKNVLRNIDLAMVWRHQTSGHLTDRQVDSVLTYHLYKGKEYALLTESDWFYVPTLFIDGQASGTLTLRGYSINELNSMKEPVPLRLVRFHEGTSRLLPLAEAELRHLGRFMQQRTITNIEVNVHVQGSDDQQSYQLSLERAQAIRSFLVEYGVSSSRIRLSAYGNVMFKKNPNQTEVGIRFF